MKPTIRFQLSVDEAIDLAEALDSAVAAIEAERNDCDSNGDQEGAEVREAERASLASFLKRLDTQLEGMDP